MLAMSEAVAEGLSTEKVVLLVCSMVDTESVVVHCFNHEFNRINADTRLQLPWPYLPITKP